MTGDRDTLTDEEREALDVATTQYVHGGHMVPDLHTVVERIVAARVRAARDEERLEANRRVAVIWNEMTAAENRLTAVTAIHRPHHNGGYCLGCWEGGGEDGAVSWPCATYRAASNPADQLKNPED